MKLKKQLKSYTNKLFLTVIVPVFNSEDLLDKLINEIQKTTILLIKKKIIINYEIILVNDFSVDDSLTKLKSFKKDKKIKIINLKKNIGQHLATVCGLSYSKGNIFITMDDDLQHDPSDIPKMIENIFNQESDICYAKYRYRKHSRWKILFSDLNNYLLSILFKNKRFDLKVSSFRSFNLTVKNTIVSSAKNKIYLDGIILQNFNRINQIEVTHKQRLKGKSNYNFKKLFTLWLNIIFGFSYLPLRIFTAAGIVVLFISFFYSLRIFYKIFILGINYPLGWPSVILSIFFFGGFSILGIGMIGEYLLRHIENNDFLEKDAKFFVNEKINLD